MFVRKKTADARLARLAAPARAALDVTRETLAHVWAYAGAAGGAAESIELQVHGIVAVLERARGGEEHPSDGATIGAHLAAISALATTLREQSARVVAALDATDAADEPR